MKLSLTTSMSPSERCDALSGALAEYFSASLAQLFVRTTLQRLSIDPAELSAAQLPRVVRLLADFLPSYISDPSRRQQCLASLLALVPEAGAEPSRVGPLPTGPSGAPPGQRSRRPPKLSAEPSRTKVLPVESAEDVVAACDAVRELARRVGFPQLVETKIATAVAELARNLQLYAKGGEVQMVTIGEPPRGVEVVALDKGPGIPNLDHVLNGKYRSKTGMGMGMRGARRLMDTFEVSTSSAGTRVVVRKYLA
jgi:serine/threonine-protein kinase RsbT